jgi:oligopeptide transport system permease protein
MARYLAGRLAQAIGVAIGVTFVIYGAVFLLPGDPAAALDGGQPMPPATLHAITVAYGLNQPFIVQYGRYAAGLLHGNLGLSIATGQSVASLIGQAWPVTATLALTAWTVEIVVGVGSGVIAAARRGRACDRVVQAGSVVLVSVPVFVAAYTSQVLLGVRLHWLPVAGTAAGWPASYLLPASVLAVPGIAAIARLTRATMLAELGQDYVRTALAAGLPWRLVVVRHALRNALVPVVTSLGTDLGFLLSGAVVVEGIFNLPGVGLLACNAIQDKDGTVVVGVATLLILVFLAASLLVDVLAAALDPRIRYR